MGSTSSTPEEPAYDLPEEEREEKVEETFTHLVILVHGYIGNDKDLAYFQDAITQKSKEFVLSGSANANNGNCDTPPPDIVFHSAKANVGNTSDGIVNGGMRLAMEMNEQINKILKQAETTAAAAGDGRRRRHHHVRLSIVAHSLGGLYSRYAISKINMDHVVPWVFCTASTPHLGVCNHTYIPIPRWAESTIGNFMKDTGRDLFCMTNIVHELATLPEYTTPLSHFQKRIALANAFATDFLTPAGTAAFLSRDSTYKHKTLWPTQDVYLLSVETIPNQEYDPKCMSQSLDRLGWTKVFLDVREQIPAPSIPIPTVFTTKQEQNQQEQVQNQPDIFRKKESWTSSELFPLMNRPNGKWHVPMAHSVSIANSRDDFYVWLNQNGKKFMDQLANDMLHLMGFESNSLHDFISFSSDDEEFMECRSSDSLSADSDESPLEIDNALLTRTPPETPVEGTVTGPIPVLA